MSRWFITLLIEHRPRRGYPAMRRVTFDARWLIAGVLTAGLMAGYFIH